MVKSPKQICHFIRLYLVPLPPYFKGMDVDGNGAITSVEMCLIMSEMMPEHSDLHNQNSFHSAIDMSLGVSFTGCQKIQDFF